MIKCTTLHHNSTPERCNKSNRQRILEALNRINADCRGSIERQRDQLPDYQLPIFMRDAEHVVVLPRIQKAVPDIPRP